MTEPWFSREFAPVDPELLPNLIERLRGTHARIAERLADVPKETLMRRDGERWSIHEHVGHLDDVEPLWRGRIEDFAEGRDTLRPADPENTATWRAGHDDAALETLLAALRADRAVLVGSLEELPDEVTARSALHPRLKTPMRVADLAHFIAEHDDHHLADITRLLREP